MGIANAMLDAADEGQPELQATLRGELAVLADAHPEEAWVEQLCSGGLL